MSAFGEFQSNPPLFGGTFNAPINQSTPIKSAFGGPITGSPTPVSAFSAFSQSNDQSNNQSAFGQSAFGQSNTQSAFGQSVFGQSNSQSAFGQSAFGQSNDQPGASSAFGQSNSQSAFGQTNSSLTQSAFGQTNPTSTTSAFASAFNQSNKPFQSAFDQSNNHSNDEPNDQTIDDDDDQSVDQSYDQDDDDGDEEYGVDDEQEAEIARLEAEREKEKQKRSARFQSSIQTNKKPVKQSSNAPTGQSINQSINQHNNPKHQVARAAGLMDFDDDEAIDSSIRIVGQCTSMCPHKELIDRLESHQISPFELEPPSDDSSNPALNCFSVTSPSQVPYPVKKYRRAAAAQTIDPSDVRTPQVLFATCRHLIEKLIDRSDQPWHEVHRFVTDRFRAVRQDCVVQGLGNALNSLSNNQSINQSTIQCYEWMVRFHIIAFDCLIDELPENFDPIQNNEKLTQTLTSLRLFYRDQREQSNNQSNYQSNEYEVSAYLLLTNFKKSFLASYLSLTPSARASREVQFVYAIYQSIKEENYATFFSLLKQSNYLVVCLIRIFIPIMRSRSIRVMSRAYRQLPINQLTKQLCMDSDDMTRDMLSYYGFTTNRSNQDVTFTDGRFVDQHVDWSIDQATKLVSSKRPNLKRDAVLDPPTWPELPGSRSINQSINQPRMARKVFPQQSINQSNNQTNNQSSNKPNDQMTELQRKKQALLQSLNQKKAINPPVNQSNNQSANQPVLQSSPVKSQFSATKPAELVSNQTFNQSNNQTINQAIKQSNHQSNIRSLGSSNNQSNNQTNSQTIKPSTKLNPFAPSFEPSNKFLINQSANQTNNQSISQNKQPTSLNVAFGQTNNNSNNQLINQTTNQSNRPSIELFEPARTKRSRGDEQSNEQSTGQFFKQSTFDQFTQSNPQPFSQSKTQSPFAQPTQSTFDSSIIQPVTPSKNQPINQTVNQSTTLDARSAVFQHTPRSPAQTLRPSNHQMFLNTKPVSPQHQPINQPINQSFNIKRSDAPAASFSPLNNETIKTPTNQTINQTIKQTINQPISDTELDRRCLMFLRRRAVRQLIRSFAQHRSIKQSIDRSNNEADTYHNKSLIATYFLSWHHRMIDRLNERFEQQQLIDSICNNTPSGSNFSNQSINQSIDQSTDQINAVENGKRKYDDNQFNQSVNQSKRPRVIENGHLVDQPMELENDQSNNQSTNQSNNQLIQSNNQSEMIRIEIPQVKQLPVYQSINQSINSANKRRHGNRSGFGSINKQSINQTNKQANNQFTSLLTQLEAERVHQQQLNDMLQKLEQSINQTSNQTSQSNIRLTKQYT